MFGIPNTVVRVPEHRPSSDSQMPSVFGFPNAVHSLAAVELRLSRGCLQLPSLSGTDPGAVGFDLSDFGKAKLTERVRLGRR
jgi:hypothetical protein